MMESFAYNEIIREGILPLSFVLILYFGYVALKNRSRSRLSQLEMVIALFNLISFAMHASSDSYFLFRDSLPVTKQSLQNGEWPSYFDIAESALNIYAGCDSRIFIEEFRNSVRAHFISAGGPMCIFNLLVYFAYYFNSRLTVPFQIIASTWHISLVIFCLLPEYFMNLVHIVPLPFIAFNAPFVIFPLFGLYDAFYKMA